MFLNLKVNTSRKPSTGYEAGLQLIGPSLHSLAAKEGAEGISFFVAGRASVRLGRG